jgi:hypothetical protein
MRPGPPDQKRKTPSQLLMEFKVRNNIRTHDRVAERLKLERSVYFKLKRAKRLGRKRMSRLRLPLVVPKMI